MFISRDPRMTGIQPYALIGPASETVRIANISSVATAIITPGPTILVPRSDPWNTRPVRTTPTVAHAAPAACRGWSVSPRNTTASTTVAPP